MSQVSSTEDKLVLIIYLQYGLMMANYTTTATTQL